MNRLGATLSAGFIGTTAFLGMVRILPKLDALEIDLINTAANLISADERTGTALEVALPLDLGSASALPYARPKLTSGAGFGALHGLANVAAKSVFRRVHPRPFELPAGRVWMLGEALNHALYGVTLALLYRALTESNSTGL